MAKQLTSRQEVVLAALAADPGAVFEPVQVQKLFFLLDERVADALGGKQFEFEPYDYGPFDKNVYVELEALQGENLVRVVTSGLRFSTRNYFLTQDGQKKGEQVLEQYESGTREYIKTLSSWVRSLSFASLVGSVYKAYPRMRENSIFQD